MAREIVIPEEMPDEVVIHAGINDNLGRRRYDAIKTKTELSPSEIAKQIMVIGDVCRVKGVNRIIISGVFYVNDYDAMNTARDVKYYFKLTCFEKGFIFVDNSFIEKRDLRDLRDKVDLNEYGKRKLMNNYIKILNN